MVNCYCNNSVTRQSHFIRKTRCWEHHLSAKLILVYQENSTYLTAWIVSVLCTLYNILQTNASENPNFSAIHGSLWIYSITIILCDLQCRRTSVFLNETIIVLYWLCRACNTSPVSASSCVDLRWVTYLMFLSKSRNYNYIVPENPIPQTRKLHDQLYRQWQNMCLVLWKKQIPALNMSSDWSSSFPWLSLLYIC